MSLYVDLFKTVASDVCVNSFVLQATDCRNQKWAHESISQESFGTDLWEQITGWYRPLSTACEAGHQRDQRRILRCGGSLGVRRQTLLQALTFFKQSYIPEFFKCHCHHTWRTWVLFLVLIFSYLLADKFWHLSINTSKKPSTTQSFSYIKYILKLHNNHL